MHLFSKFFRPQNFISADRFADATLMAAGEAFPTHVHAAGNDAYRVSIRNAESGDAILRRFSTTSRTRARYP